MVDQGWVEAVAKAKHNNWLTKHPGLTEPWEKLTEPEKQFEREQVYAVIEALKDTGYEVVAVRKS